MIKSAHRPRLFVLATLALVDIACNPDVPPEDAGAVQPASGGEVEEPQRWSPWCGEPGDAGYFVECYVPEGEEINYTRDNVVVHSQQAGPLTEFLGGGACCGGCSNDIGLTCEQLCIRKFCDDARDWHNDNNGVCGDCKFDYGACISKSGSTQTLRRFWVPVHGLITIDYHLEPNCDAVTGDDNDLALEITMDDWPFERKEEALTRRFGAAWPPGNTPLYCASDEFLSEKLLCMTPEKLLPTGGTPQNFAVEEDAGTSARLDWSWAGISGSAADSDLSLDLRYTVSECATSTSGSCLNFAGITVSSPEDHSSGDILLSDLRLSLIGQGTPVPLGRNDSFVLPEGSVEALVTFNSNYIGSTAVTVKNKGGATGRLAPQSNALTLRDLRLGFSGLGLDAVLTLDINGTYTQRVHTTSIAVINNPTDCAEPMAFRAVSNDPDGDSLRHVWWSSLGPLGEGALLELEHTVDRGPVFIVLTTLDDDGRFATDNILVDRKCD